MDTVFLRPFLPRMFFCGEKLCEEQQITLVTPWFKWTVAVGAAVAKLKENRCDFCFKFSEKVHR